MFVLIIVNLFFATLEGPGTFHIFFSNFFYSFNVSKHFSMIKWEKDDSCTAQPKTFLGAFYTCEAIQRIIASGKPGICQNLRGLVQGSKVSPCWTALRVMILFLLCLRAYIDVRSTIVLFHALAAARH